MLNLHQIILRKFLLSFLILLFVVGAIVFYWSKDFYINQVKDALLNSAEIISFELHGDSDLDAIAAKIRKNLKLRLTIVASDGTVLADSHKERSKMDRHHNRDEILQANKAEYGYKIRHSETLNKNLLYVAKKYHLNNRTLYIRLSEELKSIYGEIYELGLKILVALIGFVMAILLITYNISKEIEVETQKIVVFLKRLTKKRKPIYIHSDFSVEFAKINSLLTKVSQILTKKEKQKSKYTDRLRLSNRQKDDIISAISHEFKNPIAIINGYAQTLIEDEDINPNIRKRFLGKIYNNGDKLAALIDTLRLSTQLDSKQQPLKVSSVKLYDILLESVESIKASYPNRDIIIEGDQSLTIQADPSLISIVISNLIENAFKYSEDEVHVHFDRKRLEVIDSGIGISEKDLGYITRKFYRVQKNKWNSSMGLGLFIISHIIKLHRFKLEIESEEHIGSTFRVVFNGKAIRESKSSIA